MQALAVLSEPIEAGLTIGGSWIAEAPLPAWPGVQRWEGASVAEGTPVEILRLTPDADPLQQRAFLGAHRQLSQRGAGMKLLYTGTDSTIIRPFARTSLAELDRRLTSTEALALAGWYGPAILATEGGVGPVLTADTFVVDEDSVFRLAPLGCLARSPPTLPPELLPPELLDGGEPGPAAGLHGLGVALYRALTGEDPRGGADASGKPMPPQPPSQKVSGLDHRADRVVMALLDPDPQRRGRALPPPPLRPPRYELAQEAAKAESSGGAAGVAARLSSAPQIIVIVPRRLRPAIVRKAATWMGVDEETANAMALAGLPLPVYGARSQHEMRSKLNDYKKLRLPVTSVSMKPALPLYTLIWVGLLLATAGVAALTGLPGIVSVLAVVLASLAVPAAVGHDMWYSKRVRQSLEMIEGFQEPPSPVGQADPETDRLIASARATLDSMRALQVTDHSGSDMISVMELTLKGLEELAELERLLPTEGTHRAEASALRPELQRSLEAIAAQVNRGGKIREGSHEVEMETLLTRAMSTRRRTGQLLKAARR